MIPMSLLKLRRFAKESLSFPKKFVMVLSKDTLANKLRILSLLESVEVSSDLSSYMKLLELTLPTMKLWMVADLFSWQMLTLLISSKRCKASILKKLCLSLLARLSPPLKLCSMQLHAKMRLRSTTEITTQVAAWAKY